MRCRRFYSCASAGFEMPEDVCRFLLKRLDREMRSLFMTLDQLVTLRLPRNVS